MSDVVFTTTTTTTTTTTLAPTWDLVEATIAENFVRYLDSLGNLPGGQIILRYIKSSYKNDPIRSLFELALFIFALNYFLSSKKKENKSELVKFSQREIDELCDEWVPEPLIKELSDLEKWQMYSIPTIEGHNGSHVTINNKKVVNLASSDFLNLNESESVKEAAKSTISNTGVGACGPPNFYGTQDVHVRLEEDIAKYLDGENSILYGQDFVTAGSVIPAFLKRGDLCVVDSGVNFAIQKALIVSRCNIEWYDHNDMDHLEEILTEIKPVMDKQRPIRRRFIVTEGLFANSGDVVNLPRIIELKNKFKYRLFLDETLSIGVLGATGKGVVEHYGVPREEISITIGSMAMSFASSGGFCVGANPMVLHQRIQSIAYVFSASLPPYAAKVASQAIKEITSNLNADGSSVIVSQLQKKVTFAYEKLVSLSKSSKFFEVASGPHSPIIHLALNTQYREELNLPTLYGSPVFLSTGKPSKFLNEFDDYYNIESFLLQKVIDYVLDHSSTLISRSKLILEHENLPVLAPRLQIYINNGVTTEELSRLVQILPIAFNEVLKNVDSELKLISLNSEIGNYKPHYINY
ncbi:serine palmitoyltransferase component [Scheffersomyces stipitis CBS 6054]|uniref:serine C-palmitoyltransferase n=1 Tax=Scheffersomyces stipitis (strain ATCC 58785 / CBS 6054 / NBRC 10063 / NRRL Y-11545) TaxID=322104 RepID=A3LYW1_PICST|nr:serine palmitoyltransferase component [Scheffersomyces stipitis CBS 6054]ABN68049.2 serine palmitoyltransferase component [Scheffersomyces stipitis CBS 6054]KAG2731161.1 hypothetical protein G9P44_005577 [Scheffersomyces stipitis]